MASPTAADRRGGEELTSKVRTLRRVSIAEAVSYLMLLVATLIKRLEMTEIGVEVLGPIHGVLFLVFAFLVIRDHRLLGWSLVKMVGALVLGSLPFGGFWVERRWLPRPETLGG